MLLPGSSEITVSTIIMGNRCFRAARTSSNVIKGVVISEVSFSCESAQRTMLQHISRPICESHTERQTSRAQGGCCARKALDYPVHPKTKAHLGSTSLHRDLRIMAVARGRNREPGGTVLASDTSRVARKPTISAICRGWLSWLYSNT